MNRPTAREIVYGAVTAGALLYGANYLFSVGRHDAVETANSLRECASDLGQMGCLELVRAYVEPEEEVDGTTVQQIYNPKAIVRAAERLEDNELTSQEIALYGGIVALATLFTCNKEVRQSFDPKY